MLLRFSIRVFSEAKLHVNAKNFSPFVYMLRRLTLLFQPAQLLKFEYVLLLSEIKLTLSSARNRKSREKIPFYIRLNQRSLPSELKASNRVYR